MDSRNQVPLVDTSACLCRVDAGRKSAGDGTRYVPRSTMCVQPNVRASIHPSKPRRSPWGNRSNGQPPLLPGLPDDLAIACLIRVPRAEHCKLRMVCKRWFHLLAGNYYYSLRRKFAMAEEWLYAIRRDRDGRVLWDMFDPARQLWRALPAVPSEYLEAVGFGCAVLSGCHLYLFGGKDPHKGSMRRVIFYSVRTNKWHRAPDMLRRRHFFGSCVINNCLYVAGGEGEGGHRCLRSAEVYDPAKNRWSFISDMSTALVPFVSVVYSGKWYLKGLGEQRQVLSEVYSPETNTWSPVFNSMVTGWRNPSVCLSGRLYSVDCKDGCKLRAYDEPTGAWSKCISSKQHLGSSQALEAAALVALHGRLCVVRNNMSISLVDVAGKGAVGEGIQQWETIAGKGQIKSFVMNLLSNLAGRGSTKNHIVYCQVLGA